MTILKKNVIEVMHEYRRGILPTLPAEGVSDMLREINRRVSNVTNRNSDLTEVHVMNSYLYNLSRSNKVTADRNASQISVTKTINDLVDQYIGSIQEKKTNNDLSYLESINITDTIISNSVKGTIRKKKNVAGVASGLGGIRMF
jgi:hypothetical protein